LVRGTIVGQPAAYELGGDGDGFDRRPLHLLGERFGQPLECAERAGVGEHAVARDKAARRRDIDQQPPAFSPAEKRHESAGHAHHRQGADIAAAGRVDQHVDARIFLGDLGREDRDAIVLDGVAEAREGAEPLGRVGQRDSVDVAQDELDAVARQRFGAGEAHPAGAPGDEYARRLSMSGRAHGRMFQNGRDLLRDNNGLLSPPPAGRASLVNIGNALLMQLLLR